MLRPKLVLVLSAIALYASVLFYSSALSKPAQQLLDPENINTLYFQAADGNVKSLQVMINQAELGNPLAQVSLGSLYLSGQGVDLDYHQAYKWIYKAASNGNAQAQNNLGVMYEQGQGVQQNNLQALKWYQAAAEQGFALAQFNLGLMYENGNSDIPKDHIQAINWYTKAATSGLVQAQLKLASVYEAGSITQQDIHEATEWYVLAAAQGNELAISTIEQALKSKQDIDIDSDESDFMDSNQDSFSNIFSDINLLSYGLISLLVLLGFNGLAWKLYAKNRLAHLKSKSESLMNPNHSVPTELTPSTPSLQSKEQNTAQSVLAETANSSSTQTAKFGSAKSGSSENVSSIDSSALANSALTHDRTSNTSNYQSLQQSTTVTDTTATKQNTDITVTEQSNVALESNESEVAWHEENNPELEENNAAPAQDSLAIELDEAESQYMMANKYRDGEGVSQDYKQAVKLYKAAAQQGHAEAQYSLGQMYEHGQGIEQDYKQAVKWYRDAAKQGPGPTHDGSHFSAENS